MNWDCGESAREILHWTIQVPLAARGSENAFDKREGETPALQIKRCVSV